MPLWLLGPMVAAGIALVVFLVKRTGGDAPPQFVSEAAAWKLIQAAFPGEAAVALQTCEEGRAVVFKARSGALGIIRQIGRNTAARLVPASNAVVAVQGAQIRFDLGETGYPAASLAFSTPAEAQAFHNVLTDSKAEG
jgi:hypothetical protein